MLEGIILKSMLMIHPREKITIQIGNGLLAVSTWKKIEQIQNINSSYKKYQEVMKVEDYRMNFRHPN